MIDRLGRDVRVGRATRFGEGLCRDLYVADVLQRSDEEKTVCRLVAAVPRWSVSRAELAAIGERATREAALLEALGERSLPFTISRWAVVHHVEGKPVLVREMVPGYPLALVQHPAPGRQSWEVIADVAAQVHRVPLDGLHGLVPNFGTRRRHALAELDEVSAIGGDPVGDDALAWAQKHLPPEEDAVLVHGDLLGQNILLQLDDTEPVGLIDWEYSAIGDPAYDLAIVSRGHRRPFGHANGLEWMLERYRAAGGVSVAIDQVRFHEVHMVARWWLAARDSEGHGHPPEHYQRQLEALLRRIS